MGHLGHGGCVCGSGEYGSGNLFASSFLQKDKNPLTNCRRYKYDADQDGRTGTPESSGVSKVKVPKPSAEKHRTDSGRDRDRGILQRRPPTDYWGIKA